jgi:hypothetical protein
MLPDEPLTETEAPPKPERSFSRVIVWLIVASMGALFIPLLLVSTTIQEEIVTLQSELVQIETALETTPEVLPEVQELQEQLNELSSVLEPLQPIYTTLRTEEIDWSGALATIAYYNETQLILNDVIQEARQLHLSGIAVDEMVIIAYAQDLAESGQFQEVNIQSIVVEDLAAPTALPVVNDTSANPAAEQRVFEFVIVVELKVQTNG